jgi:hypothetical protein
MRGIDVCRTLDTPRFRVSLLVLIASNADKIAEADAMVANLRRVIADTECRPDPLTEEWRLTKQ